MDQVDRSVVAFETALGICAVRWSDVGLASVRLPSARTAALPRLDGVRDVPGPIRAAIDGIVAVLAGEPVDLGFVRLDDRGIDPWRRAVYAAARALPPGTTATYGEVARMIG